MMVSDLITYAKINKLKEIINLNKMIKKFKSLKNKINVQRN